MVNVELVYAPTGDTIVQRYLTLDPIATVADALLLSGLMSDYPEIVGLPLGLFGKRVTEDARLKTGDRIEIYRGLQLDPKEKRRQRARSSSFRVPRKVSR